MTRFAEANPDGPQWICSVDRFDHDPVALVLVRRGGYAVGLSRAGDVAASKVGSRYVQSRTAAGGWSQQRYARRRAGQADALVDAVARHTAALIVSATGLAVGSPNGLVTGGDRRLVAQVLADRRLASIVELPRRELTDLPDPNASVLARAVRRGRAVRVTLTATRQSSG